MENILFINACVRKNSRTLELAKYVLNNLSREVEEVNLYKEELLPLSVEELKLRDLAIQTKDFSNKVFDYAKQFANAQIIVIAAPYWDLTFPAIVKNYLEKITVNGITFRYGEKGIPQGLCKGKRLIYVTTSGGPIIHNFGYEYVKTLANNFYGIQNVQLVKAEGLDVYGADVKGILQNAKESFKDLD